MNHVLLIALRILHIGGGAVWVGATFMNLFFLVPTARALGPAGGEFVGHMVRVRRLPFFMTVIGWVTILSGLWLYGWRSAWFTSAWMASGPGLVYGIGGLLALVTALLGALVLGPAAGRLGRLGASLQGAPPTPDQAAEMGRLQRRMTAGSLIATSFLVLSLVAMAIARYH